MSQLTIRPARVDVVLGQDPHGDAVVGGVAGHDAHAGVRQGQRAGDEGQGVPVERQVHRAVGAGERIGTVANGSRQRPVQVDRAGRAAPLGLDHRVGVPRAEGRAEGEQLADLRGLALGDGQGDAFAVAGRVGGGGHALQVARGHGVVQRGVLEGLVQGEPGRIGPRRLGRLVVAGHDHELTGRGSQDTTRCASQRRSPPHTAP